MLMRTIAGLLMATIVPRQSPPGSCCVVGTDASKQRPSYRGFVAEEFSLETYCDLVVRMRSPMLDLAACARIAVEFGVSASDWTNAQQLWSARLTDPVQAAMWSRPYLDEYQAALRRMTDDSSTAGATEGLSLGDDEHIGRG